MSGSHAYRYATRTNGEVVIFHQGKLAKMLRDKPAKDFLAAVKKGDEQEVMAAEVGGDARASLPGTGNGPGGQGLHGNGAAHGHKEFRRKSG